jgi:glycosyltransferase involved in cell wall biosynthesis
MRIAIDLRPLQIGHEHRGIGTYLINILSRMSVARDNHYIFYQFDTSSPLEDHHLPKPKSYEVVKIPKPVWRKSVLSLTKYVLAGLYPRFPKLRETRPDAFLQPDFQLGLPKIKGCKNYVVMYDLIPLILRTEYMPSWKLPLFDKNLRWYSRIIVAAKKLFHEKRYWKSLNHLKKAHRVLSISKVTTRDLHSYLAIKESKIVTIPLAPSFRDSKTHQQIRKSIKNKISAIKNPYITYIGGTDARRKIDDLIHAFNIINGRGDKLDLILAGNEFREIKLVPSIAARSAVIDSSYNHQIHLLGFLSDAEKEFVLKNSTAFVYPTLYEGFGLPILEAMHAGCPVIAYNNSSIPEIGGEAISYSPTQDIQGIKSAVTELINDPQLASALSKKGVARAAKFNWDDTAKKTWQVIATD